jgi:hypothetical protein
MNASIGPACTPMNHQQVMEILDQVLEFLQGGLEALQRS